MTYTPTAFLNLLKAAEGEKYSLPVTNGNLDLIDTAIKGLSDSEVKFDSQTITSSNAAYSGSGTVTRVRVGATKGIIIANITVTKLVSALTLGSPAYSSTSVVMPAGYNVRASTPGQNVVMSGAAQNGDAHAVLSGESGTDKSAFLIRKNAAGSTTSWPSGVSMSGTFIGEWNGVL